jgi:hypothetical protein
MCAVGLLGVVTDVHTPATYLIPVKVKKLTNCACANNPPIFTRMLNSRYRHLVQRRGSQKRGREADTLRSSALIAHAPLPSPTPREPNERARDRREVGTLRSSPFIAHAPLPSPTPREPKVRARDRGRHTPLKRMRTVTTLPTRHDVLIAHAPLPSPTPSEPN